MATKPRLLFYFLHLLGVGHVFRAQRLIEGFAKAGIAVDVIYGGDPIEGVSFAAESVNYLPAIRAADSTYSLYLDEDGAPLSRAYQDKRTQKLLEIFDAQSPDAILVEAYPFGRRMVRHELKALFEAAKKRPDPPLIISSVRDILQQRKKPERIEETHNLIIEHFDHILVHSDPSLIELDATFPVTHELADKVTYTGFVVPPPHAEANIEEFDVIVSAGGGAFGRDLMAVALAVAKKRSDLNWCLSVGPNGVAEGYTDLPAHIKLVERLEGLSAHIEQAQLSISQCGYNTAMDVLAAQSRSACRAIFVPFDTQGQTEQSKRAELLAKAGYAINLPQSELTKAKLLNAIDQALTMDTPQKDINFDGVKNSANQMLMWLKGR